MADPTDPNNSAVSHMRSLKTIVCNGASSIAFKLKWPNAVIP